MYEDLDFYARKILTIAIVSVINFLITSFLCRYVERYILLKHKNKGSKLENMYRLCFNISFIAVFAYINRQISEKIPLPFGNTNFDPYKVKELKGSVLTAFTLFMFLGDEIKDYKFFIYSVL